MQAPGLHTIQYSNIYLLDSSDNGKNNKKLQKLFTARILYTMWEDDP